MRVTRVSLRSFRNYERLDLSLASGLSLFVGENAQGKTNFLEALYLCCMGRSHRTNRDREMVRGDDAVAHVRLEMATRIGTQRVEAQVPARGRKRILVDGNTMRGTADLIGRFRCVFFSPEDLRLVKDGPAERRRFLDRELSQIRPAYLYSLAQYTHALKQRNALLREAKGRRERGVMEWMADFDGVLAKRGCEVVRGRRAFLEAFAGKVEAVHGEITGGRERLGVRYSGCEAQTAEEYLWHLRRVEASDVARGTSTYGPHRDDLELVLDGMDIRAYGSQGQQRTAALSLKLAEIEMIREAGEDAPILLLDDVLSELDAGRQRALLRRTQGVQTIVTGTDVDAGVLDVAVKRYEVKRGRIREG